MRWLSVLATMMVCLPAMADRPILLVTPKGVFMSEVKDGTPGPFVSVPYDVIVQGFGSGGDTGSPNPPVPPSSDPIVQAVATMTRSTLEKETEALAAATIVNQLVKSGISPDYLMDAIEMSAGIVDTSLKTEGRVAKWAKQLRAITADSTKIIAGVRLAFPGITDDQLKMIARAVSTGDTPQEAIDFKVIIDLILMIIELFRNLGKLP